jgi:hypothetical protein
MCVTFPEPLVFLTCETTSPFPFTLLQESKGSKRDKKTNNKEVLFIA